MLAYLRAHASASALREAGLDKATRVVQAARALPRQSIINFGHVALDEQGETALNSLVANVRRGYQPVTRADDPVVSTVLIQTMTTLTAFKDQLKTIYQNTQNAFSLNIRFTLATARADRVENTLTFGRNFTAGFYGVRGVPVRTEGQLNAALTMLTQEAILQRYNRPDSSTRVVGIISAEVIIDHRREPMGARVELPDDLLHATSLKTWNECLPDLCFFYCLGYALEGELGSQIKCIYAGYV